MIGSKVWFWGWHEPGWCDSASEESKESMKVNWDAAKISGVNLVNKS